MPATPTIAEQRLWNRNFVLLCQGQSVSLLGSQAFFVAVSFWIAEATGSPGLLGTLLMISILPGLLLTPFGGALADRHSRIRLVIAGDLIRGVAITAVAAVHFSGASLHVKVSAMAVGMVISGLVGSFFEPAVSALIPELVPKGKLASAHSAIQVSARLASILGQSAGGVLYRLLGAPVLILANGLTFLFSAGSETFIRSPGAPRRVGTSSEHSSALREIREAIVWVGHQPGMMAFLLAAAVLNFFMAPLVALLPFYVTERLGVGANWYGLLIATLSAGSILGSVLAGLVPVAGRTRGRVLFILFVATPSLLSSLGATGNRFVALVLVLAAGGCSAFINVNVFTQIQRMTPNELRGRVISLVLILAGGAAPVGMAVGGLVTQAAGGVSMTYVLSGAFAAILGILLLSGRRPQTFLSEDDARGVDDNRGAR